MSILLEALKKVQEEKLSSSSTDSDVPLLSGEASTAQTGLTEDDLASLLSPKVKSADHKPESSVQLAEGIHQKVDSNTEDAFIKEASSPDPSLSLSDDDNHLSILNKPVQETQMHSLSINEEAKDLSPALTLAEDESALVSEDISEVSDGEHMSDAEKVNIDSPSLSLADALDDEMLEPSKKEMAEEAVQANNSKKEPGVSQHILEEDKGQPVQALSLNDDALMQNPSDEISEVTEKKASVSSVVESGSQSESSKSLSDFLITHPEEHEVQAKKEGEQPVSLDEINSGEEPTEEHSSESYDWSLSQIPGFQSEGDLPEEKESQKAKSGQKFIGLFKKGKKKKNTPSSGRLKKWLLFLSTAPVLLGAAAYFGMQYAVIMDSEVSSEVVPYQQKLLEVRRETSEIHQKAPKESVVQSTVIKKTLVDTKQNALPVLSKTKLQQSMASSSSDSGQQSARKVDKSNSDNVALKTSVTASHKNNHEQAVKQRALSAQPFPKRRGIQKVKSSFLAHSSTPTVRKHQLHSSTGRLKVVTSPPQKDLRLQAFEAYKKGDYVKAQELYRQAVLQHPHDLNIWLGLGATSLALGEKEVALKYYRQALKMAPDNLSALKAVLMLTSSHNGRWLQQIKALSHQLPTDPDIHFMEGNYYANQNDWLLAQKAYQQAVKYAPNSADILLNYAISLDHLGAYAKARDMYRKTLALGDRHLSKTTVQGIKNRLQQLEAFLKGQ